MLCQKKPAPAGWHGWHVFATLNYTYCIGVVWNGLDLHGRVPHNMVCCGLSISIFYCLPPEIICYRWIMAQ